MTTPPASYGSGALLAYYKMSVRAGQDFLGGIFRNVIFSEGFLRHLVDFVGNLENFESVPNMDPLG